MKGFEPSISRSQNGHFTFKLHTDFFFAIEGIRTLNLPLAKRMLYQLSYNRIREEQDSNLRNI